MSCTASGPQLGLNEPEEKFEGPLKLNLELVQQDGPIAVTGTLEGTAIRQCVRCLTDFSDALFVSLYAEFLRQPDEIPKPSVPQVRKNPKRAVRPVEAVEEAEEEDEVYLYQGDHLDLALDGSRTGDFGCSDATVVSGRLSWALSAMRTEPQ